MQVVVKDDVGGVCKNHCFLIGSIGQPVGEYQKSYNKDYLFLVLNNNYIQTNFYHSGRYYNNC